MMMRSKTCVLTALLLSCMLACSERAEEPEAAESAQKQSEDKATPIDGVWKLESIGGRPFDGSLVYSFARGRGTVEENGVEQGDGFTYEARDGRITLSGAKEEGLTDTGGSQTDALGFEVKNFQYIHYEISGDAMTWWVYSPTRENPNRKKTICTFTRH